MASLENSYNGYVQNPDFAVTPVGLAMWLSSRNSGAQGQLLVSTNASLSEFRVSLSRLTVRVAYGIQGALVVTNCTANLQLDTYLENTTVTGVVGPVLEVLQ